MLKQGKGIEGFFVDWDGNIRRVEAPGAGMTCQVVERTLEGQPYLGVDVLDREGFVTHEATYFESLDALRAVGVTVNLLG
jgi:hypothetical protein